MTTTGRVRHSTPSMPGRITSMARRPLGLRIGSTTRKVTSTFTAVLPLLVAGVPCTSAVTRHPRSGARRAFALVDNAVTLASGSTLHAMTIVQARKTVSPRVLPRVATRARTGLRLLAVWALAQQVAASRAPTAPRGYRATAAAPRRRVARTPSTVPWAAAAAPRAQRVRSRRAARRARAHRAPSAPQAQGATAAAW